MILDTFDYTYIKPQTWPEVFEIWRKNEENNPAWIQHWQSKGFTSWESWRLSFAEPLKLMQRSWELYSVVHPLQAIETWRGGPFRTWQKSYYNGAEFGLFTDIVSDEKILAHPGYAKMNSLYENFPTVTVLTTLLTDHGLIVIEGMHRACALALARKQNIKISTAIEIVVADARGERLTPVGMKPA